MLNNKYNNYNNKKKYKDCVTNQFNCILKYIFVKMSTFKFGSIKTFRRCLADFFKIQKENFLNFKSFLHLCENESCRDLNK